MFCTYLTFYSGNKLPPFYIGSSNVIRIKNGYIGSVTSKEYSKIWNHERRNNPSLFKVKIISLHETREEAFLKEHSFQAALKVIESPLYVNKAYAQSKFHMSGKKHSESTKAKMSVSHKGKKHTEETKKKISTAHVGKTFSEETRQKMSEYASNRPREHLTKIGKTSKNRSQIALKKMSEYASNRSQEHKAKISAALTGRKLSEEHKAKLSAQRTGKPKSQAWKDSRTRKSLERKLLKEAQAQLNVTE